MRTIDAAYLPCIYRLGVLDNRTSAVCSQGCDRINDDQPISRWCGELQKSNLHVERLTSWPTLTFYAHHHSHTTASSLHPSLHFHGEHVAGREGLVTRLYRTTFWVREEPSRVYPLPPPKWFILPHKKVTEILIKTIYTTRAAQAAYSSPPPPPKIF